jgi:hypothetical protein
VSISFGVFDVCFISVLVFFFCSATALRCFFITKPLGCREDSYVISGF